MSKDNPKGSFAEMMSGVKPLSQDKHHHPKAAPKRIQVEEKQQRQLADNYFSDEFQPAMPDSGPVRYLRQGEDPFELKKLRRGDYPPEMMLDLHGYRAQEARFELIALIEECKKHHVHCACIMHGIGSGVLKQQIPSWLAQHPEVIGYHQAPLEWGGNGALLVLVDIGSEDGGHRR
ncbi:endonuclease SmrB [Ferrimonas sp. SCSIO 43195]|uniref:endonuclease SmrB n=1 Tax=Ferrimonas sp. SCSIO 43195 TaxID=2822844 RepID=UPI002074B9B4|nr:endonuclease SmrB [Ferrimonas sp. SCSIO 43195]USD36671.1 endonuclease SmrB [Ferrimonas sp. SCSIO 43195]